MDDITVDLIPPDELHTILPLVKTLNPTTADAVLAARLRERVGQGQTVRRRVKANNDGRL